MSYADEVFKEIATNIIENGIDVPATRAKWTDGTPANTRKIFGVAHTYDLQKEFPACTQRRTNIKAAFDEILWIYKKKSNNVKELGSHIWDQWADEYGTIGKAYGYQVGKKFKKFKMWGDPHKFDYQAAQNKVMDLKAGYPSAELDLRADWQVGFEAWLLMDQMDSVLYDLKNDPFSRRIMISLWNVNELYEMNLTPCCWSVNFSVTRYNGQNYLNAVLNQRSNDLLTANNWNTVQYALLVMMIAQCVDMLPGKLVHVITDAHIYDRHIEAVEELLSRPTFDAPKVTLNPKVTNFYDFVPDDLKVEDYKVGGPQIRFEVAQ